MAMRKVILGAVAALALLGHPAGAAASPFTALWEWSALQDGSASVFVLEWLAGDVPGDLAAEVTVAPQYEFAPGDDPFCTALGQSQQVPGSTFAHCTSILQSFGQDTLAIGAIPDSASIALLFTGLNGPVTLGAALDDPGMLLLRYEPGQVEVPEPAATLLLVAGLAGLARRRPALGRAWRARH